MINENSPAPVFRALQMAALCLLIVICLGAGTTLAYFTAADEAGRSVPIERIALSLDEEWDPQNGIGYSAGMTVVKEPVITADKGDEYARIRLKVEEVVGDGKGGTITRLITDPDRLKLILGIFYADPDNVLHVGTPYSTAELALMTDINNLYDPAHFLLPTSPEAGMYYFEYKGVLSTGDKAALFSKVVVPSDYTWDDIQKMGNFTVSIEGQAIQSFGFASQADAMAELDRSL